MAKTQAQKAFDKITEVPNIAEEIKARVNPERVEIWERRMLNPGQDSGIPIVLKDGSYTVRYINTAIEGRFHRAVYKQGWEPVKIEDLKDSPDLLGLSPSTDGLVHRGNHGVELLMKIPTVVFNKIQRRKSETEMASLRRTQEQLAQAAAARFGPAAGDFASGQSVHDGISGLKGRVVDSHERIAVRSEVEES